MSADSHGRRVLYVVVCAAPPALHIDTLIERAQHRGWDVCLIATPRAATWLDIDPLVKLTGHPVRSDYKKPGEPDVLPSPDAIIVAPATFNTINKWAAGITDTLAVGLTTEAVGKAIPVVAAPFVNSAQAAVPPFAENLDKLRAGGVRLVYGPGEFEPHSPGEGQDRLDHFPWDLMLDRLT